jgi:CBS domain-containing protein
VSPDGDRVRDAMVAGPRSLPGEATVREAAELLRRPEIRAVLVTDGERLLGAVTALGLVDRVLAAGRDPARTAVADVAEELPLTIGPDEPLDGAYRLMESEDLERLVVVEDGRLLGVLSRSSLQRRLAEDEAPDDELVDDSPGVA